MEFSIENWLGKNGSFNPKIFIQQNLIKWAIEFVFVSQVNKMVKGAFTLAIFARDFALSLHVLLKKNFFSLLNMHA